MQGHANGKNEFGRQINSMKYLSEVFGGDTKVVDADKLREDIPKLDEDCKDIESGDRAS